MNATKQTNHIGRKISRIRELRDMKQEALAQALGWTQQAVSIVENSGVIEDERLEEVAKALGVSVEAIKNFSEDAVFNIIGNEITSSTFTAGTMYNCTFNPIDKLIEAYEENKKLYERLLEAEKRNKN